MKKPAENYKKKLTLKRIVGNMNSIARALNNIAYSITNLTAAIASATAKKIEPVALPAKTETSNGAGHVSVTSITTTQPKFPLSQFPKPYPEDKIEKPTPSNPTPEKHVHLPSSWSEKNTVQKVVVLKEEKEAIDAIIKAVTDKGINPKFHDKMMKKLKEDWPVLSEAIDKLVATNKKHYNPKSYESYNDIWKSSDTNWNKWNK